MLFSKPIVMQKKGLLAGRSKDTEIERALGRALWHKGYRYRKNDKSVFGSPDFTFKRMKIAIFVDGEFWHGKDWDVRKHDHKTNREFWHRKIAGNIERDLEVNARLKQEGWIVLRFWGKEVKSQLNDCLNRIEAVINENKGKQA